LLHAIPPSTHVLLLLRLLLPVPMCTPLGHTSAPRKVLLLLATIAATPSSPIASATCCCCCCRRPAPRHMLLLLLLLVLQLVAPCVALSH
jgi:hypothetical protein